MLDGNSVLQIFPREKDIENAPAIYIVLISSPKLESLEKATHG